MGGFFIVFCKRLPGRVLGPFHIYVRLLGMSRDQGTVQPHAASADPARRRFRLNGLWPSRNSEFSHEKWVDFPVRYVTNYQRKNISSCYFNGVYIPMDPVVPS